MQLRVFGINDQRGLVPASYDTFVATHSDAKSVWWVDIGQPQAEPLGALFAMLNLHPLVLESCLEPTPNARVMPFRDCLFVQIPIQTTWQRFERLALSFICLPRILLTVHLQDITLLDTLFTDFSGARQFHARSVPAVLYQVLDHVSDEDMANAIELRLQIDALSDAIDRDAEVVPIANILALKRLVAQLIITLEEQHRVVTALQTVEADFFTLTNLREYFHDAVGHLEYALRLAARQESRLGELHQHYLLMLQDKTNNRLKILTILSAIFMPLTLIAGIYGMNFRYMPELQWRFGYPLVLGSMAGLAGIMLWFFYARGWFK